MTSIKQLNCLIKDSDSKYFELFDLSLEMK